MEFIFGNSLCSVLLISLVLLANAQRASNNLRDVDVHELARQNKITKQILEAFIQKKLGLRNNSFRAPSILDILPVKMKNEERNIRQSEVREELKEEYSEEPQEQEGQDFVDEEPPEELPEEIPDSLQSVESEQIDSIYNNEGTYHS